MTITHPTGEIVTVGQLHTGNTINVRDHGDTLRASVTGITGDLAGLALEWESLDHTQHGRIRCSQQDMVLVERLPIADATGTADEPFPILSAAYATQNGDRITHAQGKVLDDWQAAARRRVLGPLDMWQLTGVPSTPRGGPGALHILPRQDDPALD